MKAHGLQENELSYRLIATKSTSKYFIDLRKSLQRLSCFAYGLSTLILKLLVKTLEPLLYNYGKYLAVIKWLNQNLLHINMETYLMAN